MPAQTDSFGFIVPNDGPEVSTKGRVLDTNESHALIGPRHAKANSAPEPESATWPTPAEMLSHGEEWHDWTGDKATDRSAVHQTVRVAVVLGAVAVGIGIGMAVSVAYRLRSAVRH